MTDYHAVSALTARVERLEAALGNIARMKMFPDDKTNRFTLLAAMEIARAALGDATEGGKAQ